MNDLSKENRVYTLYLDKVKSLIDEINELPVEAMEVVNDDFSELRNYEVKEEIYECIKSVNKDFERIGKKFIKLGKDYEREMMNIFNQYDEDDYNENYRDIMDDMEDDYE